MNQQDEFTKLISKIVMNCDDLVRGAIISLLDCVALIPSGYISIVPVEGVKEESTGIIYSGYAFFILPNSADISIDVDYCNTKALLKRFAAVDENGRAIKWLKYGETGVIANQDHLKYIN